MSYSGFGANPSFKRQRFQRDPEEILGYAPMMPPPTPPTLQMPPPEQMDEGSDTGQSLGQLAGIGFSRFMRQRSPDLKPQSGGNPLGDLQHKDGGKFLGLFARGGTLRKPGDEAVVGDEGPELARRLPGGETEIVPFSRDMLMRTGEQTQPWGSPEPVEGGGRGVPLNFSRVVGEDPQTQGQPSPAVADVPPTPDPVRFARPEGTLPPLPDDPLNAKLTPIPDAAREAQHRFTRPAFKNTGDPRTDLGRYESDLEGWQNPGDKNGRLKSFGLGLLRGFQRGGIGGALVEGIHGAVTPNADEREWRDAEEAKVGKRFTRLDAREEAGLKRRELLADVGLKEANAERARREPAVKPDFERVEGEDGFYVYDKNSPAAAPIKLAINPKAKPEEKPSGFSWLGKRYEWVKDPVTRQWKTQEVAGLPVDTSEVPVTEDGLSVKPGAALSARATREQRVYERGRDAKKDAEEEARIQDDNDKANYERAKTDVKEFNALVDAGEQARRDALALSKLEQGLKEGDSLTDAEQLRLDEAVARHESIRRQLEGRKVESPYAELGLDGRYRLKDGPKRRAVRSSSPAGGTVRNATPSSVQSVIDRIRKRGN